MTSRLARTGTSIIATATVLASLAAAGGASASVLGTQGSAPAAALVRDAPTAASWQNWYSPPSLRKLLAEVDARWPSRSRYSDGTVGDVHHAAATSQHNPVGHPNGPVNGSVGAIHALDITAKGIDAQAVVQAVVGDPRVWYVIYNRSIWSRTYGWAPRYYFGDPHSTHIHISLRSESQSAAVAAESDTRSWFAGVTTVSQAAVTGGSGGLSPSEVRSLQQALISRGFGIPAGPTGYFGSQTRAAVAAFQRSQGWFGAGADGMPGPQTLRLLGVRGAPDPGTTVIPAATGSGTYRIGATGDEVKSLQRALIARGYTVDAGATGYYGEQTRRAVAAFQRSQGWSGSDADGFPGPGTLRLLGLGSGSGGAAGSVAAPGAASAPAPAASASSATGGYGIGARGSHISDLQRKLIAAGFSIPAGPTGYFGPQTQSAVAAFQRSQGWSGTDADGIPGPGTLRRLGQSGSTPAAAAPAKATAPAAAPATPTATGASTDFQLGATNNRVLALQASLLKLGYSIPSGATGYFGPQTQAAVAAFQRDQGWSGAGADGNPGKLTLIRLGVR